jgi:two-component system nitrate/nitrite sensor histidine kinase NarX
VEAEAQLTQLEEAAREVYADLREAILSLRTVTGPNRPLLPTLREYVQRFTEQTGVETALVVEERVSGGLAFPTTAEAHLLRIVQEALTNVRKHAAATHATVRIGVRGDFVVVTVEDDGLGIGGRTDGARGYGLQTMRERAGAIGGTLEVNPGRDKGTVVKVVVPFQEDVGRAPFAG